MFSFCLTEFENVYWGWTGGQTIRKIDVHADVCGHVCVCFCSDITAAVTAATSRWLPCDWRPDNLPRSPHQTPMLLLLSRLASSINPPPSHLTHSSSPAFRLLLSSVSIAIHHLRPLAFHLTHLLFILPVFSPISFSPSFGVWVFPVFRHALCTHSAPCLCLYGNPEWTWVAQRSVKHWYRHY